MIQSRLAGALPRRLLLVAAAALVPVLAGCEAGNQAPTLSVRYTTASATATIGDLNIRNVFVLGAPLGRKLTPGQSASVFLALVNTSVTAPDKLVSITAPGTASSVTLPAGGIPVVAGHPVYYAGPAPQVIIRDLTRVVTSGSNIRLVLMFQNAGPVTLLVPVMPREAQYATLEPPAEAPTVAPMLSATPSPSVPAASPSSPSASPSPPASPAP